MPKVAQEPSEVPSEYMMCRAFRRHDDTHVNDTVTTGAGGAVVEFTRHLRCQRCGYESWTTYEVPSFAVTKRRTNYPDNYQVKGGLKSDVAKGVYLTRLGYKVKGVKSA